MRRVLPASYLACVRIKLLTGHSEWISHHPWWIRTRNRHHPPFRPLAPQSVSLAKRRLPNPLIYSGVRRRQIGPQGKTRVRGTRYGMWAGLCFLDETPRIGSKNTLLLSYCAPTVSSAASTILGLGLGLVGHCEKGCRTDF